jgi:hypothetical protein
VGTAEPAVPDEVAVPDVTCANMAALATRTTARRKLSFFIKVKPPDIFQLLQVFDCSLLAEAV